MPEVACWNCWIYTSLPQISMMISFRALQIVDISVWRPSYTLIQFRLSWIWILLLFALLTKGRNQKSSALLKIKMQITWRWRPLLPPEELPSSQSGASPFLAAGGWHSYLANAAQQTAALGGDRGRTSPSHGTGSTDCSALILLLDSPLLVLSIPKNPHLTGVQQPCQVQGKGCAGWW